MEKNMEFSDKFPGNDSQIPIYSKSSGQLTLSLMGSSLVPTSMPKAKKHKNDPIHSKVANPPNIC